MRRATVFGGVAVLMAALIFPAAVAAAPPNPGQNWGKYVNASACSGTLVINIVYGVTNDSDSGTTGNYWALDKYQKVVQVWDEGSGSYCAVVHYAGQFTTIAGQISPGGTGTLTGGSTGSMVGGYQANFTGTLNTAPRYPSTGNIGSFDLGGSSGGNTASFSWVGTYFTAVDWNTWSEKWGWVYQGGSCGTWYNTYLGTIGDIIC